MSPGDVIVGDADGCVVITADLTEEIADEAMEMRAYEDFATEKVFEGRTIFDLYPATDEQSRSTSPPGAVPEVDEQQPLTAVPEGHWLRVQSTPPISLQSAGG